ncbi:MAG TPA: prolyl oligopeptidase family serine peptidase [Acidobacteriota bacterium]|nr:prolyl oligopeptidase family serine peptidase [Acidobacteriota bacterium]
MSLSRTLLLTVFLALAALAAGSALGAEEGTDAQTKRPLSHDDYDAWKRITGDSLSRDGQWVLYSEMPGEGDAELVVKDLESDTEYRHGIGYHARNDFGRSANPEAAFSADSKFVAFLIQPSMEEHKKAKKEKAKDDDKPTATLGLLRLSDGQVETVEKVKSFKMPEEAGGWVAYLMEKEKKKKDEDKDKDKEAEGEEKPEAESKAEPEEKKPEGEKQSEEETKAEEEGEEKKDHAAQRRKKKKEGTRLALRRLEDGSETTFEWATQYRFTDNGQWLMWTTASKKDYENDGLYAIRPGSDEPLALLTGEGNYKRWTMDEEQTRLAFVSDRDTNHWEEPVFKLYGWDLESSEAQLWVAHDTTPGFPEGMAVSDKEGLSFSRDGKLLLVGVAKADLDQEEEAEMEEEASGEEEGEPAEGDEDEEAEDEEEEAKFDLWHWNDPYPQPQQKRLASQYRNETWESVYDIESGSFLKIADEELADVEFADFGHRLFGSSNLPYRQLMAYEGFFRDLYVVDPRSGERSKVAEKVSSMGGLSPHGKYVAWYDDGDYFVRDLASGETRNLTADLGVAFHRLDWDRPNPPGPYGAAGWTDDDHSLLVYDQYDIWELMPDGSGARRITEGVGREKKIAFRYRRLDDDLDTIPLDQPLLLEGTNQDTISSGYFRDSVRGDSPPQELTFGEYNYSLPEKAEESDRLLFTRTSFDEYPDLWTATLDFDAPPRRITDLGSQMDAFKWGSAELRDFYSSDGQPLKGILIKPEDFDPAQEYPLMVYIYETLHPRLHSFRHPGPGTSINPSYYVSNGYVLWMPDIEYGTGYPGKDALKCVLPGIHMLLGEGWVDRDAIGIQGHSWGGYQIAYMITQTDIFAAAEAGAPVSNMTSAYGGIRWGSGMVRQFQYERTQSRLGDTLWDVPMRYINNSPLFFADRIDTPLLILHNDDDGAVPWYQGIELIMAMRRLGKEAYMFNYNKEDHGLRKRVNQEHWTRRMAEFFDHHLKGAPMPEWMEKGLPAWEKDEDK